jgi:hypothetical protein
MINFFDGIFFQKKEKIKTLRYRYKINIIFFRKIIYNSVFFIISGEKLYHNKDIRWRFLKNLYFVKTTAQKGNLTDGTTRLFHPVAVSGAIRSLDNTSL